MSNTSKRSSTHRQSMSIAYCGMVCALSVVMMLLGAIIPIATYAAPLLCGLLLLPVRLEFGQQSAIITYAVTAILSVILGMDKETAFFYVFIAWYPLAKWQLDKIRSKPLRVTIKLALINIAIIAMYALLCFVLHLDALVAEMQEMGVWLMIVCVVVLDICMLLYDRMLFPMLMLYDRKLRHLIKIR